MTRGSGCRSVLFALAVSGCWADFPADRFQQVPPGDDVAPAVNDGSAAEPDAARVDGNVAVDSGTADIGGGADLVAVDGASCTPGMFAGCAANGNLLRCNALGTALITIDCSPAECDAQHQRCDQCDPAEPAACSADELVLCSADGLYQSQTCASGCQGGACCVDGDSDGVSNCAGDCNDGDGRVNPAQTDFFAAASDGSFDYNCDQSEEQERVALANCVLNGNSCVGDGWDGTVPGCGVTATYVICKKAGPTCKQQNQSSTQRCR